MKAALDCRNVERWVREGAAKKSGASKVSLFCYTGFTLFATVCSSRGGTSLDPIHLRYLARRLFCVKSKNKCERLRGSRRVSECTGARWTFECDSPLWRLPLHLCDSLWHDEPDRADQTNVGGVAGRTSGLTFHGGAPDGASLPPDREMR